LLSLTFPFWQVLHLFSSLDLHLLHFKYFPGGQFSQSALRPSYCPSGQHLVAASFDHVPTGQAWHTLSSVRKVPAEQVLPAGSAVMYCNKFDVSCRSTD
jgi:hypothetical protein